jgi:hypothetical protein
MMIADYYTTQELDADERKVNLPKEVPWSDLVSQLYVESGRFDADVADLAIGGRNDYDIR